MSDVVLVYPKTGFDIGGTVTPPHALLTIAAPLVKKGCAVKIIDQRIDPAWRVRLIEELNKNPICVGISSMTGSQIKFALEASTLVRKQTDGKIPIIWGGPHASILPQQTLENENIDIVVVGEGDVSFPELIDSIVNKKPLKNISGIAFKDGGEIVTTSPQSLVDFDSLLPTPWDLIDVESYIHPDFYLERSYRTLDIGQTSRGCPFDCGFCCSATLRQRKWRAGAVEKALDTIVGSIQRFNLDGIWIRDDDFYVNEKRVKAICEGMIKAGVKVNWYASGTRVDEFNRLSPEITKLVKRSGANVLKFGAESGSNRILKLIKKGITIEETFEANLKTKEYGIVPAFSFIAGFPTETFKEIDMTIDAMIKIKRDNPKAITESICIYTSFPGTPLHELALEHGLQSPNSLVGWSKWNFHEYELGGRNPWFSIEERTKLGNLTYMSSIANVVPLLANSVGNPVIRFFLVLVVKPVSAYFNFRFEHKLYGYVPELKVMKFLRGMLFEKGYDILTFLKNKVTVQPDVPERYETANLMQNKPQTSELEPIHPKPGR